MGRRPVAAQRAMAKPRGPVWCERCARIRPDADLWAGGVSPDYRKLLMAGAVERSEEIVNQNGTTVTKTLRKGITKEEAERERDGNISLGKMLGAGRQSHAGQRDEAGRLPHRLGGEMGLQGGKGLPGHPMNRGFDEYFGYIAHSDGHLHYPKEDDKKLYNDREVVGADYDKCYTTDLFTARAKKFIIGQTREHQDQPFFLYLAYDTPHARSQIPAVSYPAGDGVKGGLQ